MSDSITGGCRCGAIRYECNAEPILAGHCYCTVCQRASGTDKNSAVASPEDAFRLTGGITEYTVEADSGNTSTRGFCPTCGDPITGYGTGMAGMVMVSASSLDDASVFQPQMDIYVDSAPPWAHMDPDLPKVPGMPEE